MILLFLLIYLFHTQPFILLYVFVLIYIGYNFIYTIENNKNNIGYTNSYL